MKHIIFICVIIAMVAQTALLNAQVYKGREADKRIPGSELIRYTHPEGNPDYIKLSNGNEVDLSKMETWLRQVYHLDPGSTWKLINNEHDKMGDIHYRYQQVWQQTPVRDAIFIVHTRNGKIYSVNGTLYRNVHVLNNSSLSTSGAMHSAMTYVGAVKYKWEDPSAEASLKRITGNPDASYFPKAELLLVKKEGESQFRYAWKFDIYASKPLSRQDVYVDAQTGSVILSLDQLYTTDAHGTTVTKYSGTRAITTDSTGPASFRLREAGRGNGIQTLNMLQGTDTTLAVDFTDNDNYWNNVNANQDEVAGDAHWGAEMTYDYYWNVHGRNSINDAGFALISYVHYDVNFNNAFWDGTVMTYGDGDGSTYTAFTALDICGHEITHGLESFTSHFDYTGESGALSEGFSDVFGTCIEFYGKPSTANWNMGEDIGSVLRSLSDPNTTSNPDTYLGTYWDPNQEVHQNSTVLSHWFYLLSQGGSGTNDIGNAYSVTAQGMTKAADIAFRTLTVYLTNTSGYADTRFYSVIAAGDLYGGCTPEVEATTDAWYAVGVGGVYSPNVIPDFTSDLSFLCSAPATIQFTNITVNANAFTWYFGDGATSTATSPSHTYTANGNYNVKLVGHGGACGTDSITKPNFISIDPGNSATVSMPQNGAGITQNCCLGNLYDSGGTQDYSSSTFSTITIAPPGSMSIQLNFVSFNMEDTYDSLYIYDGPSTASPLIGGYTGNSLPNGGIINSTGGSITLKQETDLYVVESGFEINWQCNFPNVAPTPNFNANVTETCTGIVQFTDLSTNIPTSWLWDFGDGTTSVLQNPLHAFTSSGIFTVTLTTGNSFGSNSLTKTNYITTNLPVAPIATPTTICDSSFATLTASGSGQLDWYDAALGGNLVGSGSTYTTPVLYTTTTYYVENKLPEASQYGGLPDNAGTGGYFTAGNQHGLYFNCTQACLLASVKVYAQGAGNRTFALVNSSGATIQSGTYNIPDGESRVTLNWSIPVQNGLILMGPGNPNLFRNGTQGGPNLGYPFDIGGKISIYQSTAGAPNNTAFYYYCYDWELQDPTCISARIPVEATVIQCNGIEELAGISELKTGPNPATDHLNIQFTGRCEDRLSMTLFDVLGRPVSKNICTQKSGFNAFTLDVSDLSAAVYFLKVENSQGSQVVRVVVR